MYSFNSLKDLHGMVWRGDLGIGVIALVVLTIVLLGGCRHHLNAELVGKIVRTQTPLTRTYKLTESCSGVPQGIGIDSVAIYGWWWSDEQFSNHFDADNPPPKLAYIKLKEWSAAVEETPHPDRVDLAFCVRNETNQVSHITLSAVGDFKVGSYKTIAFGNKTEQEFEDKLKALPWSEKTIIGDPADVDLSPGEIKEIKFKDFHIRSIVDKYLGEDKSDDWPWRMRILICATDERGTIVGKVQATLDLIPGD